MTTIPVQRELLADLLSLDREKRIPAERHLYALLAEQPQAGAGQGDERDTLLAEARMVIASCLEEGELPHELAWMAERASKGRRIYTDNRALAARQEHGDEVRLYEAVERACGELPDGWTIELHMERGAGWIELYDAEGIQVEDFPTNNERLDYTLNDAIDEALTHSQQGEAE